MIDTNKTCYYLGLSGTFFCYDFCYFAAYDRQVYNIICYVNNIKITDSIIQLFCQNNTLYYAVDIPFCSGWLKIRTDTGIPFWPTLVLIQN